MGFRDIPIHNETSMNFAGGQFHGYFLSCVAVEEMARILPHLALLRRCCKVNQFCKKTSKTALCAARGRLKCSKSLKYEKKFLKMSRRCQK